jgi:hypothetical protein
MNYKIFYSVCENASNCWNDTNIFCLKQLKYLFFLINEKNKHIELIAYFKLRLKSLLYK